MGYYRRRDRKDVILGIRDKVLGNVQMFFVGYDFELL